MYTESPKLKMLKINRKKKKNRINNESATKEVKNIE